jgi:Zn-dependent membrane protease YugP
MPQLRTADTRHILINSWTGKGVRDMTVWDMNRMMGWSTRAVIAAVVLAALLVAAVPVAFFAGLILMLFGHILVGLALFGASVLAAIGAVVVAGVSGVRHLRKMVTQLVSQRGSEDRVVQLRPGEYDYQ